MPLDYRASVKRWMGYGEDYFKEARELFIKIILTLISLSTFVLGFSMVWVQVRGMENLIGLEKWFFIVSISFQIISISSGLWALFETNKFLNKAGENYQEKSSKLAQYMLDKKSDNGDQYPEYLWENIEDKYSFAPWQVIFQGSTFSIGLILLIIFVILLIF